MCVFVGPSSLPIGLAAFVRCVLCVCTAKLAGAKKTRSPKTLPQLPTSKSTSSAKNSDHSPPSLEPPARDSPTQIQKDLSAVDLKIAKLRKESQQDGQAVDEPPHTPADESDAATTEHDTPPTTSATLTVGIAPMPGNTEAQFMTAHIASSTLNVLFLFFFLVCWCVFVFLY